MEAFVLAKNSSNQEVGLRATEGGLLHTLPYIIAWTAKGYGFQAITATDVACLVVRPGVLSLATLYNAEAEGGKHLFIERAFAFLEVGNNEENASIWLCSHPVGMTAPTGNDISIRNSTSGKAAGGSRSVFDVDESVDDDGWFPWGNHIYTSLDGAQPAAHIEAPVNGRIIVPPGAGISITVVASHAANQATVGFHWFEIPEGELLVV